MKVRLYALPVFGGAQNVGASMWTSYVYAVNGGGGDVNARVQQYDTTDPRGFVGPVMSSPSPEETFTLVNPDESDLDSLASGQQVCLRTSDDHFVGVYHDEENHEDYIAASAVAPGVGEIFTITVMIIPSLTGPSVTLDPCGPSYAVAFMGRTGYIGFPVNGDGLLEIGAPAIGAQQKFALDVLDPKVFHRRNPKIRHPR